MSVHVSKLELSIENLDMKMFLKTCKSVPDRKRAHVWEKWASKTWREFESKNQFALLTLIEMFSKLVKNGCAAPMPSMARSPASTLAATFMSRDASWMVEKKEDILDMAFDFVDWKSNSPSFSGVSDIAARMCLGDETGFGRGFMKRFAKHAPSSLLRNACMRNAGFPLLFLPNQDFVAVCGSLPDEELGHVFAWGCSLGLLLEEHMKTLPSSSFHSISLSSKNGSAGSLFAKALEKGALDVATATKGVVWAMSVDDMAYPRALDAGFVPNPVDWSEALNEISSIMPKASGMPKEFGFRGQSIQGSLDFS